MKACKRREHRGLLHVKRMQALDALTAEALGLCARSARRARRWALLLQLLAAGGCAGCGSACVCVGGFDDACRELHGQVLHVGTLTDCMVEGHVIATWVNDADSGVGGEP